jgi:hypothetical protein
MKALKKDCAALSKANTTKQEWKLKTKAFKYPYYKYWT